MSDHDGMTTIRRYRRRPEPVEAVQVTEQTFDDVVAWVRSFPAADVPWTGVNPRGVRALSVQGAVDDGVGLGEQHAQIDDFVVRYSDGRFRVYASTTFERKFVAVERPEEQEAER